MATHPNPPQADEDDGSSPSDPPNTSRLPVEPEFMPQGLPDEPDEGVAKPDQRHPRHAPP
jgi:hypothetical protein